MKLCLQRLIIPLFANGASINAYPLRMRWRKIDADTLKATIQPNYGTVKVAHVQILVSIPKRRCRRAVDRVLMRRRVREAFRQHSLPLRALMRSREEYLSLAFIYSGNSTEEYAIVEDRVKKLINRLTERLE